MPQLIPSILCKFGCCLSVSPRHGAPWSPPGLAGVSGLWPKFLNSSFPWSLLASFPTAGSTTDILSGSVFGVGLSWWRCNSTPGLYWPDAGGTLSPCCDNQNVSSRCQMSPGAKLPQLRRAGLERPSAGFVGDPILDWFIPFPILLPHFLTGLSWEHVPSKLCAGNPQLGVYFRGPNPGCTLVANRKQARERMNGYRQAT